MSMSIKNQVKAERSHSAGVRLLTATSRKSTTNVSLARNKVPCNAAESVISISNRAFYVCAGVDGGRGELPRSWSHNRLQLINLRNNDTLIPS